MNEKEIAENKVIPYLEKLGWPKSLISQYGRVPVQMGTDVKWADIVLYIIRNNLTIPYCVIEVKTSLDNMNDTTRQAESYAKFLDTHYFCISDGETYSFFMRDNKGEVVEIQDLTIPNSKYLAVREDTKATADFMPQKEDNLEEKIEFPEKLVETLQMYFDYMRDDKVALDNSKFWFTKTKLQDLVLTRLDSLTTKEFKELFDKDIILSKKKFNTDKIFFEVDNNFIKIKKFLHFIKDMKEPEEADIEKLIDTNSDVHINGMGIYLISQFLFGAHPKDYVIVEDRMIYNMKRIGLIDVAVKKDAKGYLYVNNICKRLYETLFKKMIEKYGNRYDFGLAGVHYFLWDYEYFESADED